MRRTMMEYVLLYGLAVALSPVFTSAFVVKSSSLGPPMPAFSASFRRSDVQHRHSCHEKLCASKNNDETIDLAPHYTSPPVLSWVQKMADSYKVERGEDLLLDVISREDPVVAASSINSGDDYLLKLAVACAKTKLPIASHDFLRDPSGEAIFIYGNMAFLHGFGYEWEEFVRLPSKYCVATEKEVEERQKILDAAMANAIQSPTEEPRVTSYGDNAPLVRVRKDGRKILLTGVNLWNVYDISLGDDDDDNAKSSIESIRSGIEKGEINAIGQAVWVGDDVKYMD